MNVEIRPLMPANIGRVTEIEKQAFPTMRPLTPFKRELSNRLARYLVACGPAESTLAEGLGSGEAARPAGGSFLGRLLGSVRGRVTSNVVSPEADYSVLGFVGLWFMAGEAHITSIAVDELARGNGIGELLLMGSVELAMTQRATVVSLEVRISNTVAQSLYEKYGFRSVGIRKGYYTDDREDASIMTTDPIGSPSYGEKFLALKRAYMARHGQIRVFLG